MKIERLIEVLSKLAKESPGAAIYIGTSPEQEVKRFEIAGIDQAVLWFEPVMPFSLIPGREITPRSKGH